MRRLGVAVAVTLYALSASADVTKQQCIDADTQAQAMRQAGKLSAARQQLQICGDPTCPAMVRDDCFQRLDELERVQPTLVFDVKDERGHDLTQVHVTIDGERFTDALSGTALRVDPGRHTFTFQAKGKPVVTQTYVIEEGQKERRERVVLGVLSAPGAERRGGLGPVQIAGVSIGAFGVVGIGLGTLFGVLASNAWTSAKTTCGGNALACADPTAAAPEASTARTEAGASTAAFIAGGVLIAAGVFMFFAGHRAEARRLAVAILPGGAVLGGSF